MATVHYESKDDGGTGLDGPLRPLGHPDRRRSARPRPMGITLEGRSIRKGTAPGRDEAAAAVSGALEERLA